ncbi:hypothetical protein BJ138DRAFT_1217944 [Hygrophoropsis aurantiaca]|uniref:Uncharacterized protein n=1 Tax=Hygrophoropsis aurantiaca TaxID=72124 RepID=A0ACB8A2L2_9AGAM|nr:hypothetical protein BJ138DRAFT_1217944 [Hygrophoropsis aurantiaca]
MSGKGDVPTLRLTHKRTMSPAPAVDASPVFKALHPAKAKYPVTASKFIGASPSVTGLASAASHGDKSPSTLTFGSAHSKSNSHDSLSASPVFKKAQGHARKRSSFVPIQYLEGQRDNGYDSPSLPIPPEARRNLGLAGTMGGSIGSDAGIELDASDPDSDIPDELQVILQQSDDGSLHEVDDTMSFSPRHAHPPLPSPGLPPEMPLPLPVPSPTDTPVFRAQLIDEEDNHADIEEAGMSEEDDTKKSGSDFTGELQKLNESGGSDRRSFVEQLKNTFRAPAKIDLRYDFGMQLDIEAPPEHTYDQYVEFSPQGFPMDVNAEPSLLPGTDSLASSNQTDDSAMDVDTRNILKNMSSVGSRPSDGQLNTDFKFGGRPSPARSTEQPQAERPITLADIIPPPALAHSLSGASMEIDESAL